MKKKYKIIILVLILCVAIGAIVWKYTRPVYFEPVPYETPFRFAQGQQIVYFYSDSCPYCKPIPRKLFPLAKKMNIDVIAYDLGNDPQKHIIYQDYGLQWVPTILYLDDNKEIDRLEGEFTKKEIKELLKTFKETQIT